jgi:hypothetical protein
VWVARYFYTRLTTGAIFMKLLGLLAGMALVAVSVPAQAQNVRTLGGQNWTTDGAVILGLGGVPSGNQPQNNPCIICGANQPNQTNTALNFGYTDYGNQGNQTSETYFSSGILRDTVLGSDTISVTNYSGQQLIDVVAAVHLLQGVAGTTGFGIGIDMNQANGQGDQVLESFFMLDLTTHSVLYAFSPNILDSTPLPDTNNGTGFPDYTLTGLDTSGLVANHQYAFFARLTNTNDGPDSFFITPGTTAAVPGPIAGAGLPGLVAAIGGLVMLQRRRRQRLV